MRKSGSAEYDCKVEHFRFLVLRLSESAVKSVNGLFIEFWGKPVLIDGSTHVLVSSTKARTRREEAVKESNAMDGEYLRYCYCYCSYWLRCYCY